MVSKRLKLLGGALCFLGLLIAAYALFVYDVTTATAAYDKYNAALDRTQGVDASSSLDERGTAIESTVGAYNELTSSKAVIDPDRLDKQHWMLAFASLLLVLGAVSVINGVRVYNREQDDLWDTES